MNVIRTIIVDDSAFARKAVREMLSGSPFIEVVGMARNGTDALQMVASLNPDVVTCDLNMPELDGVGFVKKQMAEKPVPILILTASPRDAGLVLDALAAGAIDFVQKPSALANDNLFEIREELVEKIKAAAHAPTQATAAEIQPRAPAAQNLPPPRRKWTLWSWEFPPEGRRRCVICCPNFQLDFPVPLVMVLHMPVGYTAVFAEKLAEISQLRGERSLLTAYPVQRGEALLAPGRSPSHLSPGARWPGCGTQLSVQSMDKPHRPSVDVLI